MTIELVSPDEIDTDAHTGATCLAPALSHRTWRAMPVKPTPAQRDQFPSRAPARRRAYRPMTVGDEVSFAWALVGVARGLFTRAQRTWICVALGAGDSTRTVVEHLLDVIATHGLAISDDLEDSAFDWLIGFTGTDDEPRLRALVESARRSPR